VNSPAGDTQQLPGAGHTRVTPPFVETCFLGIPFSVFLQHSLIPQRFICK